MHLRNFISAIASAAMLGMTMSVAHALDDSKYPDWKGMWERIGGGSFDPSKRGGRAQQPPLTPEYHAIWEANMADLDTGGQDYNTQAHCTPGGMPRMMIVYEPMELIVTPETTYIQITFNSDLRRIYTDGRAWPKTLTPTYAGYSIGRWTDPDGDGRFTTLEVETRGLRGPRIADPSGIPLHQDNQTVIKERFFLDKADPDVLHDEITTIDHAFTRPWVVTRSYRRDRNPTWAEYVCGESNQYVFLGKETYFITGDGLLMPTKKNQSPPDLRNFSGAAK
jgi:hypothetical protein